MSALFSSGPASVGVPGLRMLGVTPAMDATEAGDVGQVRWLSRNDTSLGMRVVSMTRKAARDAVARNLRRKPPALPVTIVTLMMIAGLALMFLTSFTNESELAIIIGVVGINAGIWIAILSIGALARHRPLTSEGSEVLEHLHGLR